MGSTHLLLALSHLMVHGHLFDCSRVSITSVSQELHCRSNLDLEGLKRANGVVEVSHWQIDDHTGDLGREVLTDQSCHMTEDYGTNNLLFLVLRGLGELLTHEHVHDLCPVLVVLHNLWRKYLGHLLGHDLLRHWLGHRLRHHHSRLVVGHLLIPASRWITNSGRAALSLSLARLCVRHSWLLLRGGSLLTLEIVLWAGLIIVGWAGHSCLSCTIVESSLATSLQLTHQQAERRDQT